MYESLTHFLKTFSADSPLLWALLVMVVIAAAGLVLYGFWEVVLRGLALAFSGGARNDNRDGKNRDGNGNASGRGGH